MLSEVDRLTETFDHHDPAFAEHADSVCRILRERAPVARTEAHGGFFVVSRYEDVVRILRDDDTFASGSGTTIPAAPIRVIPIEVDPPDFHKYRRFLNPLFSPAAVATREQEVRLLARRLIEDWREEGRCDVVEQFALPLPAITILRILGISEGEWRNYTDPIHFAALEVPTSRKAGQILLDVVRKLEDLVAARRLEPRDDLVSYLVTGTLEDGSRLDDHETLMILLLMLLGGLDTTTAALGTAILSIDRHPEVRKALVDDPSRIPLAVEEFLRYEAPVTALSRTVTKPVTVRGVPMQPGDRVLLVWRSTNRDESEFEDPDVLDISRVPNRHLAFGVGIHRCLGSNLARLEMRVALEELLRAVPDYRVDWSGVITAKNISVTPMRTTIPISF